MSASFLWDAKASAPLNGQYRCETSPLHHGATVALHEDVTFEVDAETTLRDLVQETAP